MVAVSVSLYEDGKMLKGTGTRASKSRLATLGAKRLSSRQPMEDKKIPSCFFGKEVERKEVRRRSMNDPSSMSRISYEFFWGSGVGEC